jgi:hypothetical protein
LREKWASGGSSTCPALAQMPDPPRRISAVAGEEKKLLARLFPVQRSSVPPSCSARRRLCDPDSENVASSPRLPAFRTRPRRSCNLPMSRTEHPVPDEGGPRVYAYRSLLEVIARHLGIKPLLISIPFGLWHALASVAEMLDKGGLTGSIPSDFARVLSPPTSPLSEPRPCSTGFESAPCSLAPTGLSRDRRRDRLSDVDGR